MDIRVHEFFSLYQYASHRRFEDTYGDDPTEMGKKVEPFIVKWEERKIEKHWDEGVFYCLMNYSNVNKALQVMRQFVFIEKMYSREGFQLFGRNMSMNLYYGVKTDTQQVIVIDGTTLNYLSIAKDELSFLVILNYYLEHTVFWDRVRSEEVTRVYRERCVEIAGSSEYEEYYKFLFPPNDGSGETRLRLLNR